MPLFCGEIYKSAHFVCNRIYNIKCDIAGALIVAVVIAAYTVVTAIIVLKILLEFCYKKFKNKKQESGE